MVAELLLKWDKEIDLEESTEEEINSRKSTYNLWKRFGADIWKYPLFINLNTKTYKDYYWIKKKKPTKNVPALEDWKKNCKDLDKFYDLFNKYL
ncbi:hypothetical protein ABK040_004809 [Willaertia magna]